MAENPVIIDVESLSHFKAKQDLENIEKFKLKADATDLTGAVRYDSTQVLSEEQKAQARANLGVSDELPENVLVDTDIGVANGIASLDENGLIPKSQIPGMFEDSVEGYYDPESKLFYEDALFETPIAGESGKFYFDKNTDGIYRFGGSIFAIINPPTYSIATNDDIDALFA